MREKILNMLEKNGRIDIKDMAVMLGTTQEAVANEMADMEKEHIICGYHTLINWDNTSDEKVTREKERNEKTKTINWQFSTADARVKLHRLYPSFQI